MTWWQAILLGVIQGLTEFLPVSSSGHLMIFKELLGVDSEGFLDFTLTVHFATVLSTIFVFWSVIWRLLKGIFAFKYNDETDYVLKIVASMIPVGIVGVLFKDKVESLFGDGLLIVGISLCVTALLLFLSDRLSIRNFSDKVSENRNGISYLQAFIVGIAQAFAVIPGLSRSGSTISTGLVIGVKREYMAQFSFLMVLAPIMGEQLLDILKFSSEGMTTGVGLLPLLLGFVSAFVSGLFACKVMVALVKKAKLTWFAVYCLIMSAIVIFTTING